MAREKASEDLAGTVRANMEGLTKIQKEFGGAFEETSRYWSDRAKSEVEFCLRFGRKTVWRPINSRRDD